MSDTNDEDNTDTKFPTGFIITRGYCSRLTMFRSGSTPTTR